MEKNKVQNDKVQDDKIQANDAISNEDLDKVGVNWGQPLISSL